MAYIFDILILAVLVFFAWRGAKKGLILSLCGLAAIFVAFFGAKFVSAEFYEPISNIIEPPIYQSIIGVEPAEPAGEDAAEPAGDPLPDLLDSIHEAGLFVGFAAFLDSAAENNQLEQTATRTAARVLADYLSKMIAKAVLFALTFVVVLLAWFLLGHALDLAFHLPILSAVNTVGGILLGLIKAILVILVLVWIGQLAGWVPLEPSTPVLSLFTPKRLGELLNQLVV